MPAGLLVAKPPAGGVTVGLTVSRCFLSWNAALTVLLTPVAGKTQFPLESPLQTSPVQPVKLLPIAGVGISVTVVPVKIDSKQSAPQLMPGPVTVPPPLPPRSTCTPVAPRKSAVMVALAAIVKLQLSVVRPAHGPPAQLMNLLPGAGVA